MERKNIEITELYKEMIKSKDKTIRLLTFVLLGLSALVVFMLLYDLFGNGIVG